MRSPSPARPVTRVAAVLRNALRRFPGHDEGTTAVEYGLVCLFVALATVAAMQVFGSVYAEVIPKTVSFPRIQ